jgi:hypothetical protein
MTVTYRIQWQNARNGEWLTKPQYFYDKRNAEIEVERLIKAEHWTQEGAVYRIAQVDR